MNKMKWFLFLLVMSCSSEGGCRDSEDDARKLIKQSVGSADVRCVHEGAEGVDISFCTNGKTLVICSSDDGCISVNVTAESVIP